MLVGPPLEYTPVYKDCSTADVAVTDKQAKDRYAHIEKGAGAAIHRQRCSMLIQGSARSESYMHIQCWEGDSA